MDANQTRPDISNAVRAVARFSQNAKEVHVKVTRKIIDYLSATAHLGLTFRKDSKLEDVQLEHDLETYVDADYVHKADDRRSVLCVAVCCGAPLCRRFVGRKSAPPFPLQRRSTWLWPTG